MPTIKVAEQAGVGVDGKPRPTEDHVVVLDQAVVLLDGATSPSPELPSGGWYAGLLAEELAGALRAKPDGDLRLLLADAIATVAGTHDLRVAASPSSTVAMLRWSSDHVDGLVLADSPIVAFGPAGADPLTDDRLALLRGAGQLNTTAEVQALRNQPEGFWVAEADPAAASYALCRSWPRTALDAVVLASDGVSVGIDDYGLFDWPHVLTTARERGLLAVLEAVREAESSDPDGDRWPRPKRHDDQALVLVDFTDHAG
ncbi:hypothetical protein LWP59_01790 [Amycolatopsis acidiphila]|uniref:Protein phosphatase 2C domain-containing protein n=1 Tax=Amycolatopsis acidiphila TaxID=715473 RepID=A0A558AN52_9PSEU|nr:hypothetical protein [Amycolatopsis acidiphila]TVT25693.1 hypothetical protein FNH06_02530 [Amycolatopsis acidiphila]UIJ60450.1 hypothetical protein LWP59_01790 [Amycolatopsis acidiphila]GHG82829.1 hypothetical protein GCM10017788_53670 [Amycolatopsis acidiphila]